MAPPNSLLVTQHNQRLNISDTADLVWLWTEFESEIGVRSVHGSMVDRLCRLDVHSRGGGDGAPMERAPKARERFTRISRALRRLSSTPEGSKALTILHRFYGLQQRSARWLFGEISPLCEYTATVDRARMALVWHEAGERIARIDLRPFDAAARDRILKSVSVQVQRELTTADAVKVCVDWVSWPDWMPCGSREKFIKRVSREAEALLCDACEMYRRACDG